MGTVCSRAEAVYVANGDKGAPASGPPTTASSDPPTELPQAGSSTSVMATGPIGVPGSRKTSCAEPLSVKEKGVALSDLLEDPAACKAMESYALAMPVLGTDLRCSSYLRFYLDVSDLTLFDPGSLRNDRVAKIFQRYLAFGARYHIELPFLVLEDIKHALSEEAPPADVYAAACAEALDFVRAEIFPRFMNDPGPLGYLEACVKSPAGKRQVLLESMTKQDLDAQGGSISEKRLQLESILSNPVGRRAFRSFIQSRHAEENLVFYLSVTDFETMYADLFPVNTSDSDEVRRRCHYFLTRATKIYDTHVRQGALQQVNLSHAQLLAIQESLKQTDAAALSLHIFRDAREEIFKLMVANYLNDFVRSDHYHDFEVALHDRESAARELAAAQAESTPSPVDNEQARQLANSGLTLEALLGGPGLGAFKSFLSDAGGNLPALMLCEEVKDFRSIPPTQTGFIAGRAQKLFDKFFERGSPLEVALPADDRAELLRMLDTPNVHMFDAAHTWAMELLRREEWPVFRRQPSFAAVARAASEAGGNTDGEATDGERKEDPDDIGPCDEAAFNAVVHSEPHCRYFKQFLESEFCPETLLFVLEVYELRRMPQSSLLSSAIRKVYGKFVRDGALQAVRLSDEAREAAEAAMQENPPSRNTFSLAQAEVYEFLQQDQFPKFLRSQQYETMRQDVGDPRTAGAASAQQTQSAQSSEMSADMPFERLLDSRDGTRFFASFCRRTLCEENFAFYVDVEDFKRIPGDDYMRLRAAKIYKVYVAQDARMQVNISSRAAKEIKATLEEGASRNMFQRAQNEIFSLLARDTYPKFKASEEFTTLLNLHKGSAMSATFNRVQDLARRLTTVG